MTVALSRGEPVCPHCERSNMFRSPFFHFPFPGALAASRTDFPLDRRRFCSVALAGLIVPAAVHLPRPEEAPGIVIRDGWILLESDLQ
jgi:hypothetical protein